MTQLVPYKKYEISLDGELYPSNRRKEEAARLPIPLEAAKVAAIQRLTLARPSNGFFKGSDKVKSEICERYARNEQTLRANFDGFKSMLLEISRANIARGGDVATAQDVVGRFSQWLEKFQFSPPAGLRADVAVLPNDQMVEKLNEGVPAVVQGVYSIYRRWLDAMVDAEQIGLVRFVDRKTCEFHFFCDSYERKDAFEELSRKETHVGRNHRIEASGVNTTTKTKRHVRHQHDLVGVDVCSLDSARFIPHRLQALKAAIPEMIRPFVQVVTGKQIFEGLYEEVFREITRDNQTRVTEWQDPPPVTITVYRNDPAIILGQYVLGAWGDEEEQFDKRVRQKWDQLQTNGELIYHRGRYPQFDHLHLFCQQVGFERLGW